MPERNDPLMRYIALRDIKEDPEVGAAAQEFHWMMAMVLLRWNSLIPGRQVHLRPRFCLHREADSTDQA